MSKLLLCYDFSAVHTSEAAQTIGEKLSFDYDLRVLDIFDAVPGSFEGFDVLISVISTWHDGELPPSWDESIPMLRMVDFTGKKVAFCGIGDPKTYPDFFCDPIGDVADIFEFQGGKLIGETPAKNYKFSHSVAQRGDQMVGLCLDYQNGGDRVPLEIDTWCKQLIAEIGK